MAKTSTSFKPGHTPPPGPGRPKIKTDIRALALAECPDSIRILAEIRDRAKSPAAARVAACNALLDRGIGKPVQSINHRVIRSASDLTDEELQAIIASDQPEENEGMVH